MTAAGSLWLALLIAQPASIHARHLALHQALGRISYALALLFAMSSVLLSHHRLTSMDDTTFATDAFVHYLPFYATVVFVVAYAFGLWFRRAPAVHSRFMLCTAIPLIDPVFGRVLTFYLPPFPSPWLYQIITFGAVTAIAAILVFTFRGAAPARRALLIYFVLPVTIEIGWFVFSPTAAWFEAVTWFRDIPFT